MGAFFSRWFGHVRLTTAIAGLAIGSITIAILAVSTGVFVSLSGSARDDAAKEMASATRTAAAILQVNLPSLEIISDDAGNVAELQMRSMPRFRSHDVIDTLARVTGQDAAIYVYNTEVSPDFVVGTSSLLLADGERQLEAPIVAGTPLFDAMQAGSPVRGEVQIEGANYLTLHQPIRMADGTVIGALLVAVDRAPIEAVIGKTLTMLGWVGAIAFGCIGAVALLVSRMLTRPIPRLSGVMSTIAAGELDIAVPYTERRNEIGAMAQAVEVFRGNMIRVAELGVETDLHLVQATDHAGQLEAIARSQLVAEFNLAGDVITANGNFLALTGYELADVVGKPNAIFLFDVDPASPSYRQFWLELASGQFKGGEYRRRTRDGREVWIQSTFNPIIGLDGRAYKIVQFATDVTARRLAVAAIGEGLAQLADGDLTACIDMAFPPEFEGLRIALNGTVERFAAVVGQIKQTSHALKTATGEILSGANDLSERTTRQASTIEETAAAIEQLAGTVAHNASLARQASSDAEAATRSAEDGGAVMAQANDAMERISGSSARISNIIGMIDDIAFQTNLLALNASVEAARAGDAGKGFAVVAVEVRRLAQSAASASAEVKVLIEQSANEVRTGSGLVADAAARLANMLERARTNNGLMKTIAEENGQQAAAIDEVSVAVRALDEMTQHNAALVEQTNAAIGQSEAQANELDGIVDVFTLADAAVPRDRRRAA